MENPLIQNTEFPKDAEQKVMGESQIILQLPDVGFLNHTVVITAIQGEMNCYWNP